MKIDDKIANRMRRDHFTRINMEKNYIPFNQIENDLKNKTVYYSTTSQTQHGTI
jgi:hypothetical protein